MISDIRLQQFRSYLDDSFEFDPAVNIIVGPNGSGKTNLLEAILVMATGSSYRVKDIDLIRYGAPWMRLEALVGTSESRVVAVEHEGDRAKKTYKINDVTFSRLTLAKKIPVVLFEPTHLQLLSGPPDLRRQYLDDILEQTKIGYSTVRRQYMRILAQRNALLKHTSQLSVDQLFVWNVRLSEFGEQVAKARDKLVERINERLSQLYQELSNTSDIVTVQYNTICAPETYATEMLRRLEAQKQLDLDRGFTGCGPHREDFVVFLNGHAAAQTASRGETRTILLALKVVEAELVQELRNSSPLLLLDDVFSELDGKRRQALTRYLQHYQTFITTTDADVVVQQFTQTAQVIPLVDG